MGDQIQKEMEVALDRTLENNHILVPELYISGHLIIFIDLVDNVEFFLNPVFLESRRSYKMLHSSVSGNWLKAHASQARLTVRSSP